MSTVAIPISRGVNLFWELMSADAVSNESTNTVVTLVLLPLSGMASLVVVVERGSALASLVVEERGGSSMSESGRGWSAVKAAGCCCVMQWMLPPPNRISLADWIITTCTQSHSQTLHCTKEYVCYSTSIAIMRGIDLNRWISKRSTRPFYQCVDDLLKTSKFSGVRS